MVSELQRSVASGNVPSGSISVIPASTSSQEVSESHNPIAPEFWSVLYEEMAGLRDVLGEAEDTDPDRSLEDDKVPSFSYEGGQASAYVSEPHSLPLPLREAALPRPMASVDPEKIFEWYGFGVDTIIKVFHLPSMLEQLRTQVASSPRLQALQSAMSLLAVCTLEEAASFAKLGACKAELILQYRADVEARLCALDWLVDNDIHILQALVIYVLALRAISADASAWTLVSILVRKASAIGLGMADLPAHPATSIDAEDHRWLWYCIGLLDSQSALDRGSWPLLSASSFNVRPVNVGAMPNGTNFSGFDDAPAWPLQCEAMVCLKTLYDVSPDSDGSLESRSQVVAAFETLVEQQYTPYLDLSRPEHLLCSLVAHESIVTMQLLVMRPLHRMKSALPSDGHAILGKAVRVLESSMEKAKSVEIHRWAWYSWVKWYALAVALAELCNATPSDEVHHAWNVSIRCYDRYAAFVADGRRGLLWAPIKRLFERACKRREALLRQPNEAAPQTGGRIRRKQSEAHVEDHLVAAVSTVAVPQHTNGSLDSTDYNMLSDCSAPSVDGLSMYSDLTDTDLYTDQAWLNWNMFTNDMNDPSLTDWDVTSS